MIFGIGKETTTYNLKVEIFQKQSFPVADQILVFAGKQLEDNRKLWTYGIKSKHNLDLFSRAVSDYFLFPCIFLLFYKFLVTRNQRNLKL